MRTVNFEEIYNWNCCWLEKAGGASRLASFSGEGTTWSAKQALEIKGVNPIEKLWVVLREDFLDANTIHEFLQYYAECLVENAKKQDVPVDERLRTALKIKRTWLTDQSVSEQLEVARKDTLSAAYEADTQITWRLAWAVHKMASDDLSQLIEPFFQLAVAASNTNEQADLTRLSREIKLAPDGEHLVEVLIKMISQ